MTAVQAHWILIDGEWQLHSCKPRRLSASLVTKHGRQSQDDEIGDDSSARMWPLHDAHGNRERNGPEEDLIPP